MYSHYMNGNFTPIRQDQSKESSGQRRTQSVNESKSTSDSGLFGMLSGLVKRFSLQGLDTGDILLILIILFLFLEGDNLELVITLGLLFLFGLSDD